jgi:pyridoxal 5'-phosphate synthase pdxT subunit
VQGAFAEHQAVLQRLGAETVQVRLPVDLNKLDGLIIPGGESTTISKLMSLYNIADGIVNGVKEGLAVFGTCAGMIVMAREVLDADSVQPLCLMGVSVRRNAFGRQVDSFEADLAVPALGEKPFPAVFIRAPLIEKVSEIVEVLARLSDGTVVAARQGKLLVAAFHPELTEDDRFHRYFMDIVRGVK